NSASISLVEIGETNSHVTGTVQLPKATEAALSLATVAFSSDGRLGFTSDGDSKILEFNAVSGELIDSIDLGPQPFGLALFEQNGESRLAVISIPVDRPAAIVLLDATDRLSEVA